MDTVLIIAFIAAVVLGAVEVVRSEGRNLVALGLTIGFGALLLDRLV